MSDPGAPRKNLVLAGIGIGAFLGGLVGLLSLVLLVVPPLEGTTLAVRILAFNAAPTVLIATAIGGGIGALVGLGVQSRSRAR